MTKELKHDIDFVKSVILLLDELRQTFDFRDIKPEQQKQYDLYREVDSLLTIKLGNHFVGYLINYQLKLMGLPVKAIKFYENGFYEGYKVYDESQYTVCMPESLSVELVLGEDKIKSVDDFWKLAYNQSVYFGNDRIFPIEEGEPINHRIQLNNN